MRLIVLPLLALLLAACSEKPTTLGYIDTRRVTLPGGQEILAEVMMRPEDMMRGMMFRDSLAPDRGMLFIHGSPGNYPYYMYQVRIPLDIIWLDTNKTIVEIAPDTPPCTTNARACPTYGGKEKALMVLELAGGMARKYNLRVGQRIDF